MRRTIRSRFTLISVGMMAAMLIITWCINNWWLESYYMMDKTKVLKEAYELLDPIITSEEESGDLTTMLRQLREKYNIAIVVYNSSDDQILVSSTRDIELLTEKVRRYMLGQNGPKYEVLEEHDNYMIQKTFDSKSKAFYLESWGFFSNNDSIFIMSTPLDSIRESVDLSNRFLAYVGIAVILFGSIIIYFTTNRITAPIKEISSLSKKMSDLDFEARYVDTNSSMEEISTLGHSMNELSSKLKDTIGELKSANLELKKDIQEKIQVDEMRKDFIANVSHELKTPIALIQGYAEGLTEGMADDKDSRDYYCDVIMDEANKMNKMVKQLLTLTAMEFGGESTSMEQFDLADLIRGVLTSSQILLSQKSAQVEFHCPEPLLVWADEFKIEEVVTNYLNNAINHLDGERKIRIDVSVDGDVARIAVFNTGLPIPEEDIPNLWTKFFKVDKAHTREYGGSGIGLSIVKAIMEMHHGGYGVVNHEDGVEFWFTLDCGRGV